MSKKEDEQLQNLNFIADAPPTQPQGLPEAPTLQQVPRPSFSAMVGEIKPSASSARILG